MIWVKRFKENVNLVYIFATQTQMSVRTIQQER